MTKFTPQELVDYLNINKCSLTRTGLVLGHSKQNIKNMIIRWGIDVDKVASLKPKIKRFTSKRK